jgi:hypothetical protein
MSASHVATAVAAIVSSLQAAPPVAPQLYRVRRRRLKDDTTTAVVVCPLQTEVLEPPQFSGQPIAWQAVVAVECYAKAAPGQSPDVAVDDLTTAVYARLMADPTLAGACNLLQPLGLAYDFDADGDQTACATFTFSVRSIVSSAVF